MNVVYTNEFRKQFDKLPKRIQVSYRSQEAIFTTSSRDARLHVKKLKGQTGVFSFRITRAYRALFAIIENDSASMLTIGHRKNLY